MDRVEGVLLDGEHGGDTLGLKLIHSLLGDLGVACELGVLQHVLVGRK